MGLEVLLMEGLVTVKTYQRFYLLHESRSILLVVSLLQGELACMAHIFSTLRLYDDFSSLTFFL